MSLTTTLNLLRLHGACGQAVGSGYGYDLLRAALGRDWPKDKPIPLSRILETNGLDDTLWCFRATPSEQAVEHDLLLRLLVADFAEGQDGGVLALYGSAYPGDARVRDCIRTSRRFALGLATREELDTAAAGAVWAARAAEAAEAARAAEAAGATEAAGAAEAAWAVWTAWAAGAAGAAEAVWTAWAAGAAGAAEAARAAKAAGAAGAAGAVWTAEAAGATEAAGAAEREWQTARTRDYLEGRVDIEAIRATLLQEVPNAP